MLILVLTKKWFKWAPNFYRISLIKCLVTCKYDIDIYFTSENLLYLITRNVRGHVYSAPGINADSQTKFAKVKKLTQIETLEHSGIYWGIYQQYLFFSKKVGLNLHYFHYFRVFAEVIPLSLLLSIHSISPLCILKVWKISTPLSWHWHVQASRRKVVSQLLLLWHRESDLL